MIFAHIRETNLKCPNCREAQLVMADRQGVEIDYCPDCRGIWLDRGELDKIIERSQSLTGDYAAERPRQQKDYGRDRQPMRRKKSKASDFLSDIFDFG